MSSLYAVEVEPEVRSWLESLSDRDLGRVDFMVGLLAEHAESLGEPYSRHLGGKVRGVAVSGPPAADESHLLARSGATSSSPDGIREVATGGIG
jgi:hypothetical protein